MTGTKMVLVTGIVAEVAAGSAGPGGGLLEVYKTGGIVAILLVLLAVVYLDGRKRQEKTEKLIEADTAAKVELAKATQAHSDITRTQTAAIFEMSQTVATVVRDCATMRGIPQPPLQPPRVEAPK